MPPADTPPNAAFIDDPGVVSDKRLELANVDFFRGFMHAVDVSGITSTLKRRMFPNLGFDGGVLEISSDGGNTFQYVPARDFLVGGYNRTISTDRGSPIAGLQAWSGNSVGL